MRIGKESSLKGKQELLRDTRNLWFKLSRSLSDEEGAEEVHRQALRLQETLLGKEHPDTDEHEQPSLSAERSGQVRAFTAIPSNLSCPSSSSPSHEKTPL